MQYKSRVGGVYSWFRLKLMYSRYRITSLRCCSKDTELVYFFLATPTVRPRRPVVLVCWPRTRRSQWWRRPRWARIWIYSLDSCIKSTDIISLIKTQKICLPSWVAPNPHGAWCQDRWRLTGQRYRPSSPFVCSRTSLGFCTGVGWAWWSPYDGSRPRPIDRHAEWYFNDQSLIGLQVGTNSTAHESRHWDTGAVSRNSSWWYKVGEVLGIDFTC